MNAEAREKIFIAIMEDISEVIAKHLPNFNNNLEADTWKMLQVFTEEAIAQLG